MHSSENFLFKSVYDIDIDIKGKKHMFNISYKLNVLEIKQSAICLN